MFDYKRNRMRKYTATEIYHFYITDNHWLFMEKNKMIMILEGIRDTVQGITRMRIEEAIELIQDITPTELAQLKQAYILKWREVKEDKTDIVKRLNRYQDRVILVNAN